MRYGREHRASMPSPVKSVSFSAHQCVYQLGSYTEPQCSEFLLGFYYIGLTD